jgi:hypothetical protein
MFLQFLVGPFQPLVPEPRLTDLAIQSPIQRHRTRIASLDANARVREFRGAELRAVVEREIRADDLDAPQR